MKNIPTNYTLSETDSPPPPLRRPLSIYTKSYVLLIFTVVRFGSSLIIRLDFGILSGPANFTFFGQRSLQPGGRFFTILLQISTFVKVLSNFQRIATINSTSGTIVIFFFGVDIVFIIIFGFRRRKCILNGGAIEQN